jgi:energy-coupling factor transport system ATP-binding protein
MNPEVLILDEPTTGQDWANNVKILDLVQELNEAGTTVILISHNMQFVAERTRRSIVMRGGSVLLDTSTSDAFSQTGKLEQAFIRPPQITRMSLALHEVGVNGIALSVDELADAVAPHITLESQIKTQP